MTNKENKMNHSYYLTLEYSDGSRESIVDKSRLIHNKEQAVIKASNKIFSYKAAFASGKLKKEVTKIYVKDYNTHQIIADTDGFHTEYYTTLGTGQFV